MSRFSGLRRSGGRSTARVVVGVDIGLRRVKVAAVAAGEGPAELRWALDIPTPAGIFGAEGQFDGVAAGRVLAQLFAGTPAPGPFAGAVLLPSLAVRVRRLQTAVGAGPALQRMLAEDSELRVPGVSVEALHHVVSTLRDTPADPSGDGPRSYVAAAARRDAVRAYSAAGTAGGVEPLRLAVPAVALANLHRELHPDEEIPVVLIHVGSVRSELVVVDGGAPVLSLPLVQGGDHLFHAIRAAGRPDPDLALRDAESTFPALEEWIDRLRGSYRTAVGAAERYLRRDLQQVPVRLSGGIARYPIVGEQLAAALPAPVGLLDPGIHHPVAAHDAFGPALVLALGAALEARNAVASMEAEGASEPEGVFVDLAQADDPSPSRGVRPLVMGLARDRAVWVALLIGAVLSLGVPWWLGVRLEQGERDLARVRETFRAEAAIVAADSARVSALQADSVRLSGTLGMLALREAGRYGWPKLMHSVAEALPPYVWLEGLEMEAAGPDGAARVNVVAVAPSQADVSGFERGMARAGAVSGTRLENSESLAIGPFTLVGFRLSGTLTSTLRESDHPRQTGAGYNPETQVAPPSQPAP
jgi:hypothetical protein